MGRFAVRPTPSSLLCGLLACGGLLPGPPAASAAPLRTVAQPAHPEPRPALPRSDGPGRAPRWLAVGAASFGLVSFSVQYCMATYWRGGRVPFYSRGDGWFERGSYALGADKLGHAWNAYWMTRGSSRIFRRLGVSARIAPWLALANSQVAMAAVEVGDGTATFYGYSWTDIAFNLVGGLFGALLERLPELDRRLAYKASYRFRPAASAVYGRRTALQRISPVPLDYDYTTFWIVLKGEGLLPRSLDWLNLAVGYRIEGFEVGDYPVRRRFFMLSLDVSFASGVDRTHLPLDAFHWADNMFRPPTLAAVEFAD